MPKINPEELTPEAAEALREELKPGPLQFQRPHDLEERSFSQGNLFAALAQAQAKFSTIEATRDNDFYSAKYAPLDAIWEAVRPILAEAGLCVIQEPMPSPVEVGCMLRTTIAHTSGEWRSSVILMPVDLGKEGKGKKAPAFGSAQSYARRYALTAVLGVATSAEDDDGRGAPDTGLAVGTETAAYKGWMAWGQAQVLQMEKAANTKQLDRIVLESLRKTTDQAVPPELKALLDKGAADAQERINLAEDAKRGDPMDPDGDIPQ